MLRCISGAVETVLAVWMGLESGFELAAESTSVDEALGLVGLRLVAECALSVAIATTRSARPVAEGGLLLLQGSLLHEVAWTSDEPGMGALSGIALATRTVLVDGLLHGATRASAALRGAARSTFGSPCWHEGARECIDLAGLEVAELAMLLAAGPEDVFEADRSSLSLGRPEVEVILPAEALASFMEVSVAEGDLR